jgi:uncharacterized membrane protein
MALDLARIARHMTSTDRRLRRAFPASSLEAIEQTIRECEQSCDAEIRFVVEGALDGLPLLRGQSARERAIEVFSRLRVWDTEHNNGVLIYVLLADRRIEIVADRWVDAAVGACGWEAPRLSMESAFRGGEYERGAIACIRDVARHAPRRLPRSAPADNELPDAPSVHSRGSAWR